MAAILMIAICFASHFWVRFSEKCETELSEIEARFEHFLFLHECYKDWG